MTTPTTEAFEAPLRAEFEALARVSEMTVTRTATGNGYTHLMTQVGWDFYRAATERAAKQEREKAEQLLKAAKDLSKMYTHAWDQVDGGLVMMGESVPLFERRHKAVSKAIQCYEAAAIRGGAGKGNADV